ncbi:MAG: hypothetical protein WC756_03745 [Taibaiella sp.]|jgi:hypothetical protein
MIRLADKTNVAIGVPGYPYGKIINDTGTGNGTSVDEQVYNDVHQFLERMFDQSGLTANNLPDNGTNGYQLYQALQTVVAAGMANVASGAWIDGITPTVTTDTGTAELFSVLTNRYKIIGKTFFWEFIGALSVTSGTPNVIKITHPIVITQKNFNNAAPRKVWGFYKSNLQTMNDMQLTTIDIRQFPSAAFSGLSQYLSFSVILELV